MQELHVSNFWMNSETFEWTLNISHQNKKEADVIHVIQNSKMCGYVCGYEMWKRPTRAIVQVHQGSNREPVEICVFAMWKERERRYCYVLIHRCSASRLETWEYCNMKQLFFCALKQTIIIILRVEWDYSFRTSFGHSKLLNSEGTSWHIYSILDLC